VSADRLKSHPPHQHTSLLLINAELIDALGETINTNVRICGSAILAVGALTATATDTVIDAEGGLLLPGLSDHHVHLVSYAASLASIDCGPPSVCSAKDLMQAINAPGDGWLRGTNYFEGVVPDLDRNWLDQHGPDRPIRIQHRSGRLWILNSLGLAEIEAAAKDMADHERQQLDQADGRLFNVDALLGQLTRSSEPPIAQASRQLAAFGVTSINDMTPSNDLDTWQWFNRLQDDGELLQRVRLSGRPSLAGIAPTANLAVGETKVHLHEASLPKIDAFITLITQSHGINRPVAVHCVTEVELVFTLSAFETAGCIQGDRIEHASVIPEAIIPIIKALNLSVVTQPNFIESRGDDYAEAFTKDEQATLYRVNSIRQAGISVAFGTDMPFGNPDPWKAMQAAVDRTTQSGLIMGVDEDITPEQALMGYLGTLDHPFTPQIIQPGGPGDACLLSLPWQLVRNRLSADLVRMTIRDGKIIYRKT
jgi:predicted amidohydrolase YtcJ